VSTLVTCQKSFYPAPEWPSVWISRFFLLSARIEETVITKVRRLNPRVNSSCYTSKLAEKGHERAAAPCKGPISGSRSAGQRQGSHVRRNLHVAAVFCSTVVAALCRREGPSGVVVSPCAKQTKKLKRRKQFTTTACQRAHPSSLI